MKKYSACYASAQTDQGQIVGCDLFRNHTGDHYDAHLDYCWALDLAVNPWAVTGG